MINSHAIQSQNISKFTGDISKNTSKSTSETNQIKVLGGAMGGAYPLYASLSQAVLPPRGTKALLPAAFEMQALKDYGDL